MTKFFGVLGIVFGTLTPVFLGTFAQGSELELTQVPFNVAAGEAAVDVIPNFRSVSPGIYRGGRPGSEGLAALAALGVKTDLNLDNDSGVADQEEVVATALGMRFISHPMSGFWKPQDQTVDAALAILADPSMYPVFVHCQHGQDRTGVVVGLHRVFFDHWSQSQAYSEMLEVGFHPLLVFLKHYFNERTDSVN